MSTRDDLTTAMNDAWVRGKSDVDAAVALLAERGMVVLGPDGEPLDVRPALRALGNAASRYAQPPSLTLTTKEVLHRHFDALAIGDVLADACLAAAEVEL